MPEYRTGQVLGGDFRVISMMGAGAYGTVLRVERLLDGREYALKLFHASQARERVQRELRALQRVNHPHIVRVVWAGQLPTQEWYLLTEVVEGPSLRDVIDEGSLPVDTAIRLTLELLDALAALHPNAGRIEELRSLTELDADSYDELQDLEMAGLVHRDVKPENILLRDGEDLVLVDFGIASRAGTAVLTQAHTPGYTPPDVDLTRWSPDVDLYAAGAVLFEMLTGGSVLDELAWGRLNAMRVSHSVQRTIARACAAEREQRFQTAAEMSMALLAAQKDSLPTQAVVEVDQAWNLPEYEEWDPSPLPSAGGSPRHDIVAGLLDIVEVEGPIVCERLYQLYVSASGDPGVESVRRPLNQAVYHAIQSGQLNQLEPLGGGQYNKTVFLPDTEPVRVRQRGARRVVHIPCSEVQALRDQMLAEDVPYEYLSDALVMVYGADDESWDHEYLEDCIADAQVDDVDDESAAVDDAMSDSDPRWSKHSGGRAHAGPDFGPGDEEIARTLLAALSPRARTAFDYLLARPGIEVGADELAGVIGVRGAAGVAAALASFNACRQLGRSFPFRWWKGNPSTYAVKRSVADVFLAAARLG